MLYIYTIIHFGKYDKQLCLKEFVLIKTHVDTFLGVSDWEVYCKCMDNGGYNVEKFVSVSGHYFSFIDNEEERANQVLP